MTAASAGIDEKRRTHRRGEPRSLGIAEDSSEPSMPPPRLPYHWTRPMLGAPAVHYHAKIRFIKQTIIISQPSHQTNKSTTDYYYTIASILSIYSEKYI